MFSRQMMLPFRSKRFSVSYGRNSIKYYFIIYVYEKQDNYQPYVFVTEFLNNKRSRTLFETFFFLKAFQNVKPYEAIGVYAT